MKALLTVLENAGLEPVNLSGNVLVLRFSGRVLGLCPDADTNAMGVNSAFDTAACFPVSSMLFPLLPLPGTARKGMIKESWQPRHTTISLRSRHSRG
jgi:hypothetical protein